MASSNKLRTAVILGSIVLHAGVGVGMFVSGVWNIERLDGDIRAPSIAVVLPPMPAPEGGPIKLPEATVTMKERKIVDVLTQPEEEKKPVAVKPSSARLPGEGSGEGSGKGSGSAGDPGECMHDCGPGTGSAAPKKDPPPKDDEPTFVPPNVLTMMRISGTTQIHPQDATKTRMLRDGLSRTNGVVKVCISETGRVMSVDLMKSTKYPEYDAMLIAGVRDWKYRPYAAKGRNVRVCGVVTFVYGIAGR